MTSLPYPALFWVSEVLPACAGLYISPTSVTFAERQKSDGYDSKNRPNSWWYYYPRLMVRAELFVYWTMLCPMRQAFDGFLSPLNELTVESQEFNGKLRWCISEKLCREWERIENLLQRACEIMTSSCYIDLDVDISIKTFPWPFRYNYKRSYDNRKTAVAHLRTVQAVFMLKVTQLTYMNFLGHRTSTADPT